MSDDILVSSGYNSKQYIIVKNAKEMIVENAYLTKGRCWDILQEITSARLLKEYIDKHGILQVSACKNIEKYANKITSKHIIKYNIFDKITEFANKINVSYSSILIDDTIIKVYEYGIFIEPLDETTSSFIITD